MFVHANAPPCDVSGLQVRGMSQDMHMHAPIHYYRVTINSGQEVMEQFLLTYCPLLAQFWSGSSCRTPENQTIEVAPSVQLNLETSS